MAYGEEEDHAPAPVSLTTTFSPRRRRRQRDPIVDMSPVSEPPVPPEELLEAYGRIDDEGSLVDDVDNGDFDEHLDADVEFGSNNSYLGDYAGESSHRRKLGDYTRDEQRLKSVTTRESPVFSKAKMGIKGALTAENLQRRDREFQHLMEDDNNNDDFEPPVNVPSSWIRPGNNHRSLSRRNRIEATRDEEEPGRSALPHVEEDKFDSHIPPQRMSPRSPRHENLERTNGLGNHTVDEPKNEVGRDDPYKELFSIQDQKPTEGIPIADTPIVVYKNSTFTKPSPKKRDSQDLLRRLARAESPGQVKTPEPQKPPAPRIYDKTPIVPGAYINTPMPERAAELPEHFSKDIVSPTKPDDEPKDESQRTKPQVDIKPNPKPDVQSRKERTKPPLKKPRLPKSGLEAIIEDAKSGNISDPLGDSTIESLEKFKQSTEQKTSQDEEEGSDAYQNAVEEELAREAKKPARGPDVELEELKEQRRALSDKIAQMEKDPDSCRKRHVPDKERVSSHSTEQKERKRKSHHLHVGEDCEKCGAYSDGRVYAAIPLPRLWRRDPVTRRIRLTRLGWFTILSLIWFCSESTMCDYYCHPLISNVCDGNCLKPDAPRFPFVIPTMLWRWLHLEAFLTPIFTILVAFFRLITQLLGLWDGFVDDVPAAVNFAADTSIIPGSQVTDFPTIAPTQSVVAFAPVQDPWPGYDEVAYEPIPEQQFEQQTMPEMNWDDGSSSIDDDEYL